MNRLVHERQRRHWSQYQAAKVIGVSQATIAALEIGNRGASDTTKQKIADAYGLTVGELFFGERITNSN